MYGKRTGVHDTIPIQEPRLALVEREERRGEERRGGGGSEQEKGGFQFQLKRVILYSYTLAQMSNIEFCINSVNIFTIIYKEKIL